GEHSTDAIGERSADGGRVRHARQDQRLGFENFGHDLRDATMPAGHDAILRHRRQHAMSRLLLGISAAVLAAAAGWAQPDSRSVLGERTPLLAAGADAIRAGRYDDGIR